MMADRLELPTKEQIGALTDTDAIRSLLAAIDGVVATIETRLLCNSADHRWRSRAGRALVRHKAVRHQLSRRLNDLGLEKLGRKGRKSCRPEEANDPLTNQVILAGVAIDAERLTTADEINGALEWLLPRIAAVESDRTDELDLPDRKRDQRFLAAANAVLKAMRGYQNTLSSRRGALARAAKEADQARRERMFIDAVKGVLPEETFKRLWAEVNEAATFSEAA